MGLMLTIVPECEVNSYLSFELRGRLARMSACGAARSSSIDSGSRNSDELHIGKQSAAAGQGANAQAA